MADQETDKEPVIIVDANGDEHEFPPGMDPKVAGDAVKRELEKVRQEHMAAQHETDSPFNAFMNSVNDTVGRTARSAVSGIGTALNPMNAVRGVYKLAQGVTDPASVMQEGYEAAPAVIAKAKQVATEGLSPEEGGQMIGQLGTGLALGRMPIPSGTQVTDALADNPVVGPVLRQTGRVLATTGRKAGFTARIAGAHQLLGGNLIPGMALTMAPDLAEGAGNALIRLGTKPGALLSTAEAQLPRIKMDLELATSGDKVALASATKRIETWQSNLADNLGAAQTPDEVKAVTNQQNKLSQLAASARRIAVSNTKEEMNAARLELAQQHLQGLEAGPTKVTTTTSGKNDLGETTTARTTYAPKDAETSGGSDAAKAMVKQGYARDIAQAEEILAGKPAATPAPMRPVASHQPSNLVDTNPTPPTVAPNSLVQQPGSVASEVQRLIGDATTRGPIRPMASHTPSPEDFGTAIDALKPEEAPTTAARPAQQPVSGIRPSLTGREMSATPGLSVNDVKSIGLNPSLKITKLTPEMATKILRDRATRAVDYREMAALKKRLEQLIANPNQ